MIACGEIEQDSARGGLSGSLPADLHGVPKFPELISSRIICRLRRCRLLPNLESGTTHELYYWTNWTYSTLAWMHVESPRESVGMCLSTSQTLVIPVVVVVEIHTLWNFLGNLTVRPRIVAQDLLSMTVPRDDPTT